MAEYIEREALEVAFDAAIAAFLGKEDRLFDRKSVLAGMSIAAGIVHTVPAADVAPVRRGRWVYDGGNEYVDHYHCDQCGAEIDLCNEVYTEPKPNYCQNCNAKMDKETDDAK